MPIRAEMKARYPSEWPLISLSVRAVAGWRCQWCDAADGKPHPITRSVVKLTCAHVLNEAPEDVRPENLAALCQRCHNHHDGPSRRAGIRRRRDEGLGQASLLDGTT